MSDSVQHWSCLILIRARQFVMEKDKKDKTYFYGFRWKRTSKTLKLLDFLNFILTNPMDDFLLSQDLLPLTNSTSIVSVQSQFSNVIRSSVTCETSSEVPCYITFANIERSTNSKYQQLQFQLNVERGRKKMQGSERSREKCWNALWLSIYFQFCRTNLLKCHLDQLGCLC